MRLSRVLQFEPPIPLWQLGIAAISRKHPYLSGFPIELECTREKRRELKQHLAQMGCYFLLIEEELRIRPTHGFIVCGDGARHRIENTEELRAWVLDLAGQIRAARREVDQPILVNPKPGQCRPCGQRGNCGQARL
jgi:CRISPR-associated exonuclease Cas4